MTKAPSTATTPARGRPSSAPTVPTPSVDINNAFSSPRRLSASRISTPSSSSNQIPTSDDRSTTPRASVSKPPSARPSPLAPPLAVTSPRSAAAVSKSAPPSATFSPRSPAANHGHNSHHPTASRSTSASPTRRLSDSALDDNIRQAQRSAAAANKGFPNTPAHPRGLPTTTPMTARSANMSFAPPGRDARRVSDIGLVPSGTRRASTSSAAAAGTRASRSSLERAQRQFPMWVNLPPCVAQSIPVTTNLELADARFVDAGDADVLYKLATSVIATAGMEAVNEDDEVLRRKVGMFQASLRTLESNYPNHIDSPHPCNLASPHLRTDLIYIQAAHPHLHDLCFRVLLASLIAYCTDDLAQGQVHQPITADDYSALAEVCLDDFDAYSESEVMDTARNDQGQIVQLVKRKVNVEGSVARLAMVFLCLAFDSGANGPQLHAYFHKDLTGQHAMWDGMFDQWNSHIVCPTAHPPQPMPGDVRELLRQHVWDRVKQLAPALADVHVPNPRPFIKPDPAAGTEDPAVRRKRSRLSDPVPLAARRLAPVMLDMTADSDLDADEMERQADEQVQAQVRGGHRVTASGAHKRQHTTSSAESMSSPEKAAAAPPPFKRLKRVDQAVADAVSSPARHAGAGAGMEYGDGGGGAWDAMDVDSDTGPFFAAPPPPPPPAASAGDVMMQDMFDDQYQGQADDARSSPAPQRMESASPSRQLHRGLSASPARALARGSSGSPAPAHVRVAAAASVSPARAPYMRSVSNSPSRAAAAPRATAADQADADADADRPVHRRRRAPRIKWTPDEEEVLERAMGECDGSWARILRKYPDELGRFTQVQLKDKARNLRAKRERAGEELGYLVFATTYPAKDREGAEEERAAGRGGGVRALPAAAAAAAGGQEDEDEEELEREREGFTITVGVGSGVARQLGQPLALTDAQAGGRDEEEDQGQQGGEGQAQPQGQQGQDGPSGEEDEEEEDNQELAVPPSPRQTRKARGSSRPPRHPQPVTRSSARLAASQDKDGHEQDDDEDEDESLDEQEKGQEEAEDPEEYRPEEDDEDD